MGPDCRALPEQSLFVLLQWADDAFLVNIYHGAGESCDFKTTTMADTIEKPVDSGKTFFDISINTDQIGIGFEANTPE